MNRVVSIEAKNVDTGIVSTYYFSDKSFTTLPSDTPANTFIEGRISSNAIVFMASCFNGSSLYGKGSSSVGAVRLLNNDGGVDYLRKLAYRGRAISVYQGDGAFPSGYTKIISGKIERINTSISVCEIIFKDRGQDLENPISVNLYAGTGSVEGGDDVRGKRKPIVIGRVFDFAAPLVDSALTIYQVNDGTVLDVTDAFDGGRALTKQADYSSLADMIANAPTAGGFRVFKAGGYVRLAAPPVNEATFHVTEANRNTASAVQKALTLCGLSSADWDSGDMTALSTASSANVGWVVYGDDSGMNMINELCSACGAFWYFDENSKFRIKQLVSPDTSSILTITDRDILNMERINQDNETRGEPVQKVSVGYARCWQPLSGALDVSITAARRTFVQNEWRYSVASSSTVASNYINPPQIELFTSIVNKTDADSESARLLNMFSVNRDTFNLVINDNNNDMFSSNFISTIKLGSVIKLTLNRFDCENGRYFRVIGIKIDWILKQLDLTIWG